MREGKPGGFSNWGVSLLFFSRKFLIRKPKKAININNFKEFAKVDPHPSTPLDPDFFYVRLLGCPIFIYVRNVVHLEIEGKPS